MASSTQRPVNLNLLKIRLPIAGVMSIMHRISGFFLALLTPVIIYWLDIALSGETGFIETQAMLQSFAGKVALFVVIWALMHHILAGIRYLLLDIDVGIEKPYYRQTAWAVVIAAPLIAVALTGGLL